MRQRVNPLVYRSRCPCRHRSCESVARLNSQSSKRATFLQPSPKVAVIRFDRGMQQGLLGRISRDSILEYHAFGIISEGPKARCHYMICGVQGEVIITPPKRVLLNLTGDFTKSLVKIPPKTLWTRELKFGSFS